MRRGLGFEWLGVLCIVLLWGSALRAQTCDDGNACTANDTCSNNTCTGSPQSGGSCTDLPDCMVAGHCQDGACIGTSAPVGTSCAGGCGTCQQIVPGTPTLCMSNGSHTGDACTPSIANGCFVGQCQISPFVTFCLPQVKPCPNSGSCKGMCNFETGQCDANLSRCFPGCEVCNGNVCMPSNLGTACDDGNVCTSQSSCQAVQVGSGTRGLCMAGTPSVSNPTATVTPGETPTATPRDTPTATPRDTPTLTPSGVTPTPGACTGDCNDDKQVVVNEMIIGVRILLGESPISQCRAFDRNGNNMVEVNELIGGVNALLNGCA
jgi:hypothetical protein